MRHLVVTDLDPGGIGVPIQAGLHGQAGAGVRGADQLDHGFIAHQRLAAPILGDGGKQTMLDFMALWKLPGISSCSCKFSSDAFIRQPQLVALTLSEPTTGSDTSNLSLENLQEEFIA